VNKLYWVKNNEAYYAYKSKNSYLESHASNIYTICGNVIYFIQDPQAKQIGVDKYFTHLEQRQEFCQKHYENLKEHKMTNENQKDNEHNITLCPSMENDGNMGVNNEQPKMVLKKKDETMTNENNKLQDLILTTENLKEIKVLDKPTDTPTRLVWIMRTIAYEYSRGKKGCCVPLNEICIHLKVGSSQHYEFNKNIVEALEHAGYTAKIRFKVELIGDCLEIVWG